MPQAFIKSVALKLNPRYKLDSSPFPVEEHQSCQPRDFFIGRNRLSTKFLKFLTDSAYRGVFLVTGFRGMGKTSFVNDTIYRYKTCRDERERDRIIDIHLTLAQNNPKEIDILRLLVASIFDAYKKYSREHRKIWHRLDRVYNIFKLLTIPVIIIITPMIADLIKKGVEPSFWCDTYHRIVFVILGAVVAVYLPFKIYHHFVQQKQSAMNRIRSLFERCYNTLAVENSITSDTIVPLFNLRLFGSSEKKTKQYPVASNKEIEFELQKFLQLARNEAIEFIFIFDELDKLEPLISDPELYPGPDNREKENSENAFERSARERKQAIISIIASLKNFFTTAEARFIFIAGNEMFDASLADVSDRQSSISSIFTYVFNIESLLKEKDLYDNAADSNNLSMSDAIEFYIKKILFDRPEEILHRTPLHELVKNNYQFGGQSTAVNPESLTYPFEPVESNHFDKVYFVLQSFITYLTYRSNGSPKKLIRELHEFVRVRPHLDDNHTIIGRPADGRSAPGEDLFLYFSYYDQYRIGFINYLYRPFLIRYGRSLKLYSDSLIVSTPYLFDHLIKFHPFAFSMSNLEQVPEVLSANKTPLLRLHIQRIIEYLSANHIKEIDIGLFNYKFHSRTLSEIAFISKISEQDAAALNYALDESYLVKLHVRNKIRDLRETYAGFIKGQDNNTHIFSIAHLNGTLGDLYYYDQQYDDAIVAYSDAIRTINLLQVSELTMQDLVMLLRMHLKIGVCFEKISAYGDALAHYSNSSTEASRFMLYRFAKEKYVEIYRPEDTMDESPKYSEEEYARKIAAIDDDIYHSASLSDLLQIVLQCFVSQLFIQEKKSVAGVSETKIFIAFGSFMKITEGFIADAQRNHILKASSYLHVGQLFYFKNSERPNALNENSRKSIPDWVFIDLERLRVRYNNVLNPGGRRPVLALYFYIMGLIETYRYRNNPLIKDRGRRISPEIENICGFRNIAYWPLTYMGEHLNQLPPIRGIHYKNTAVFLSNIGDCLLANYRHQDQQKDRYHEVSIKELFVTDRLAAGKKGVNRRQPFEFYLRPSEPHAHSLADVLRCYYYSGWYYEKQGKASSAAFQYTKILYVIRMILCRKDDSKQLVDRLIMVLRSSLVRQAIKQVRQVSGYTDRHMFSKAKSAGVHRTVAINNLSNQPETREITLLFTYIRIKLSDPVMQRPRNFLISQQNSISTQYGRFLELATMARSLQDVVKADFIQINQADEALRESILGSFTDYLYCRLTILNIISIFGQDYWLGSSYLAYTHYQTARFLSQLRKTGLAAEVERRLAGYIGTGSYTAFDHLFHFEKAREYYQETILLHTAGDAYRKMIDELIYLEDDFNDSAYHFGAALDRYMLVNGVFHERQRNCESAINAACDVMSASYTG